ncbi:MAG: substrate-binding domain-containing protein [Lentisphaeria bacterium]|nr:substrate-binding domain-containing protein [Lentisphaeria bacterium]
MVLLPDLNKKMQQDIIDGVFKDTMPSIRQLALHYKVGESTMKLSLKQLKADSYLIGHQGKCIQVNPQASNNPFFCKNIIFFIKLPRLEQNLYAQIIESLRMTFETYGAYVHLINSVQQLKSCRFDIDILIAAEIKGDDLQYIAENFTPAKIIMLNSYAGKYSNVGTDNFQAGYNAIKYLHEEKNHNVIGILGIYFDYKVSYNKFRREGANEYCRQHPEVKIFEVDTENFATPEAAIENLFAQSSEISAVFATMDTLAFHVYTYAAKKKIAIPSQLAVLGFDNTSFCNFTIPELSSFQEDIGGISAALQKLVHDKLTGINELKEELFCPKLVKRKSV